MDEDWDDVASTLTGDRQAYDRIVARYHPAIRRQMQRFSRLSEVVEELTQDVFVEAFLSLKSYRRTAPFSHWLSRIATRAGYAHWRRQTRQSRQVDVAEWDIPETVEAAEMLDPAAARQVLDRILEHLGAGERLALTLHYLEERSIREICELTGWSTPMVKMRIHRARKRLRGVLRQLNITEDSLWTE